MSVAPDIQYQDIDDQRPLQEGYSLDSADFLNYLIQIHDLFGIEIPAKDYGSFATIKGAVDYIKARINTEN